METISDMLVGAARYESDRVAVIFEDQQLTYKELNREINKLANGLIRLGIKRGDFVMTQIH